MLVQIGLEILWLDSVVSSCEPGLQIAEDSVDMRRLRVRALRCPDDAHRMLIASKRRVGIPTPPIGPNSRTGLDVALDEGGDALLTGVFNHLKPNPSDSFTTLTFLPRIGQDLHRSSYKCLVPCRRNTSARLAFCRAANVRFIRLDQPCQPRAWPISRNVPLDRLSAPSMPTIRVRRMDIDKANESLKAAENCFNAGLNN